jgi:hypothetical protein
MLVGGLRRIARSRIIGGNTRLANRIKSTGCIRWMARHEDNFHKQASRAEKRIVPLRNDE